MLHARFSYKSTNSFLLSRYSSVVPPNNCSCTGLLFGGVLLTGVDEPHAYFGCRHATKPDLPALSNIAHPHLRREQCLHRELDKIRRDSTLPINDYIPSTGSQRLKSRNPPIAKMNTGDPLWKIENAWLDEWRSSAVPADLFELNPRTRPPGFTEQRRIWCLLNRFRTDVGNCAYHRNKWGWCGSAACECGHPKQTARHIVLECPHTKFDGSIEDLKRLSGKAVEYFGNASFRF